jgi:hypothetical protein
MRLSDAGLHQRQTKALYPNHRLPPWATEDVTRDRFNRLLDASPINSRCASQGRELYISQKKTRETRPGQQTSACSYEKSDSWKHGANDTAKNADIRMTQPIWLRDVRPKHDREPGACEGAGNAKHPGYDYAVSTGRWRH